MCALGEILSGCRVPGAGCRVLGAGCRVRPSEPWKCLVIHIQFQRSVGLLITRGRGVGVCVGWGRERSRGRASATYALSIRGFREYKPWCSGRAAAVSSHCPATVCTHWRGVRLCGCAAGEDGCGMGCRMGAGRRVRARSGVRLQKPQHVSRQGESERFPLH